MRRRWAGGPRTLAAREESSGGKFGGQRAAPRLRHEEAETGKGEVPCPGSRPGSGSAHLGPRPLMPEVQGGILPTAATRPCRAGAWQKPPYVGNLGGNAAGAWSGRTWERIREQGKLRDEEEVQFKMQAKRLPRLAGRGLGPFHP